MATLHEGRPKTANVIVEEVGIREQALFPTLRIDSGPSARRIL
jgi:hypothetical protein